MSFFLDLTPERIIAYVNFESQLNLFRLDPQEMQMNHCTKLMVFQRQNWNLIEFKPRLRVKL